MILNDNFIQKCVGKKKLGQQQKHTTIKPDIEITLKRFTM